MLGIGSMILDGQDPQTNQVALKFSMVEHMDYNTMAKKVRHIILLSVK